MMTSSRCTGGSYLSYLVKDTRSGLKWVNNCRTDNKIMTRSSLSKTKCAICELSTLNLIICFFFFFLCLVLAVWPRLLSVCRAINSWRLNLLHWSGGRENSDLSSLHLPPQPCDRWMWPAAKKDFNRSDAWCGKEVILSERPLPRLTYNARSLF